MNSDPIIILQMQRMGDLILTFPLILWLTRRHPGREIWVVGEEAFVKGLYPVSPQATYFSWDHADQLANRSYHLVINLSHRREAAALATRLSADEKIGPLLTDSGVIHIRGDWQLYRTSLTGFNRHNRFHWADMNALDVIPLEDMASTRWAIPRQPTPNKKGVGIFIGASDENKRPSAAFSAELAAELLKRDLRPILFGGPSEIPLADEIRSQHKGPLLSMVGKLKLHEFVTATEPLSLFITPDTGPMHLAAWSGLKVLNLSMGPVAPWETGPYQPGHYVHRASVSCTDCWHCAQPSPLCKEALTPSAVAMIAMRLLRNRENTLSRLQLPGTSTLRTARGETGLYALSNTVAVADKPRNAIADFWQAFFGWQFKLWDETLPSDQWKTVRKNHPLIARQFPAQAARLLPRLKNDTPFEETYWASFPPLFRPLVSWLQMHLANGGYTQSTCQSARGTLERLLSIFS